MATFLRCPETELLVHHSPATNSAVHLYQGGVLRHNRCEVGDPGIVTNCLRVVCLLLLRLSTW